MPRTLESVISPRWAEAIRVYMDEEENSPEDILQVNMDDEHEIGGSLWDIIRRADAIFAMEPGLETKTENDIMKAVVYQLQVWFFG